MSADSTILTFAVAIYVGAALSTFFGTVTRDLVTPLLAGLFPGVQTSISSFTVTLGGVKFNVGEAVAAAINLGIALVVVQFTLPYIKQYAPLSGGRR